VCHSAPHFIDNGFYNVGLRQFGQSNPDMGRYKERAVAVLMGAFDLVEFMRALSRPPAVYDYPRLPR